ncbi:hypothetical protein JY651_40060 [Pyxidicoccus parkwayensis]|uniref:Uncharacterized protein n=1 Tax=Pyxidicoccus parkwayensis TaxID=2813578 RepID=A0ABX7NRB5_9BACT|nr:hypothetical protein [Pyxidicoccus parkwaysis]QSQ21320.1 hypothetical protein JY651_40060 [Pyxidicoccus parkwaysis]
MASDYYALYARVRLTREQIFSCVVPLLHENGARWASAPCEALAFEPKLGRYVWTGESARFKNLDEALERARAWQGVAIYFEYPREDVLGSLSIVVWNDEGPAATTVALCENSTLFNLQREHAPSWEAAQELFISVGQALQSEFCFLRREPPLRTMSQEEVAGELERIAQGRFVPTLLATHVTRFTTPVRVVSMPTAAYRVDRRGDYVVITHKSMGTPEAD